MPRRIALFANGKVGLDVARYLAGTDDEVVLLFLSGQYPLVDSEILSVLTANDQLIVCKGDLRSDLDKNLKRIRDSGAESILTVYWPFILPEQILELAELTLNFHPALLPQNRGWYPHVHNILEGSPAGVTLHKLSKGADEGDIWAQREVSVNPWDCAGDLYKTLQKEITNLFIENWPLIKSNKLNAVPQSGKPSSYHAKKEIEAFDEIELDKNYTGREIINLLRARTFGDRGFAYFKVGQDKIYLTLKLEKRNQ